MKTGWKTAVIIVILFSAGSCSMMMDGDRMEEDQLTQAMSAVKSRTLLNYVAELSSEKYAGRLTGTQEYIQAAEWLAAHFKRCGMVPAGDEGSYMQSFSNPYTIVFKGGELAYHHDMQDLDNKRYYAYEEEYYPGSNSGDGAITADLVYVGYGISAPELNYDDYEGIDVEGKIVLMEPEVPVSPEEDPEKFKDWRPYSLHDYKVKMAVARGAGAMLYHYLVVNPNIAYIQDFYVSQVGEAVVADAFSGTGRTHEDVIRRIEQTLSPQSFDTGKLFTMENLTEHHPNGTGYNVLGEIKGADPELKDEYIILGAHLDGLGFCYEIMPGANDNASGIAVMMGVAEALSLSPVKPRRSILFIGFGSEEQGLRGSRAYVADPAVPLDQTAAFINLDMVGAGDKLSALAAENYPEFWEFIQDANQNSARRGLQPRFFPNITRPRLDAAILMDRGVPSLSFSAFGEPTFPHTTKDTAETITPDIMEDLARILFYAVLDMSQEKTLNFRPESE
jgi:hypothetical protein